MVNAQTSTNGHVRLQDVMRLGDTTPKQFMVAFEYNGEPREYPAWLISSRRYPSSVAAELDDARNDYIGAQQLVNLANQPINPILFAAVKKLSEHCAQNELSTLAEDGRMQAIVDEINTAITGVEQGSFRSSQKAWERYITRCLQAVVIGLDYDEADILGPDRMRILVRAGLFPAAMLPAEDAQAPTEDSTPTPQEAGTSQTPPAPSDSIGAKPARGSRKSTT